MLHQVGVGVLGPVFRTYEPTRDRLVAVKVFRLDITPEHAQSLADALASATELGLFHPSIVEPIAAGIEGTIAYRAEEYVAAESLDVALRHYAPAPIEKVLPFITQLAGAVDFARTSGVGHGALHPRDIFITPDEARASGFGVVDALERVGIRAPVRRPYSAPERVDGRPWSTQADVFSLAVIAYELLTSRRPAGTGAQIGSLGDLGGDHAGPLHDVLARAMDEDPARRFPTALGFASALGAAASARSPVASAPSAAPPVLGLANAEPERTDTNAALNAGAEADAAGPMTIGGVPVSDDQIEDSLAIMPPPRFTDVDAEPAEAAIEEDTFRAEQPAFDDDDVMVEQEEDELDFALRPEDAESEDVPAREDLFDDEAVEDLALEPPVARFASDFDPDALDEPDRAVRAAEQRFEPDEDPLERPVSAALAAEPAVRGYSSITDPPVVTQRPRSGVPFALILMLGLLLGFAAGYLYAKRTIVPESTVATQPPTPGTAAPQTQGTEFSEQTVAPAGPTGQRPNTDPPNVPAEVPDPPAPTPRAPAPATKTGSITVNSTPSNAGVTMDGKWVGRTPLVLDDLRFGSYTLRIIQDGYVVDRHVVPLSADAPARTITSRLQRVPGAAPPSRPASSAGTGTLYVDSRPRGARVILDGKVVGVTPLRLPGIRSGAHAVRLELADHQPWRTNTTVVAGQEARVTGSLERIR